MAAVDEAPSGSGIDKTTSGRPQPVETTQDKSDMAADGSEEKAPSLPEDGATDPPSSSEKGEGQQGDGSGNELQKTPSRGDKLSKKQLLVIVSALSMALFLAALDMTIIATALPSIAKAFKASESAYTWMASSYLLANASFLPLWGKLSDIWGRRIIIMIANLLFLAGSLVCALAVSVGMLIGGRVIQGIGGGGLIILAQICVSDLFSTRERPLYYAMFGATWAVAGSLGPVIGGALTQEVTWRWCFYINLPVGGVSLVILLLFLKVESPKTPLLAGLRAIDWLGTICIIGGTVMFLFGLQFGGIQFPWSSATIICLIIFGVVVLAIFGIVERKIATYPVMPTSLFEDYSNIFLLGINWVHASIFIAGAYFLPIYFQVILGVGPIMSGVYLLPQVLGLSVLSMATAVIIRKTGRYREVIQFGLLMSTLGYGLYIDLKPYTSWPRIIIYQIISGVGIGPNFQAPLIAIQAAMRPGDVATATSTFGFLRQLSTSASIVLGGVVYQNVVNKSASEIVEALGPELAPAFLGTIAGANIEMMHLLTESQKQTVIGIYTHALSRMWIFYVCIAALGIVFSLFIKKRELSKQHEVTKTGLAAQEQARQERLAEVKGKKANKLREKEELKNGATPAGEWSLQGKESA